MRRIHPSLLPVVLTLALTAFLSMGCGQGESEMWVDLEKREELTLAKPQESLTYAYLPQYSHTVSYERHRLLLEYLRDATGLPIRQIFPDTFDEHIKMVERGEIDISFSNPLVYLQLAETGSQAFARIVEPSGRPDFRGQIICRVDNPLIKTLADCRGKRWIAVDPGSAGGYLFPLGHFLEHGMARQDFAEIAFAPGPGGKQEKVVLAVYTGAFDVGTIREGTLDIMAGRIDLDKIRVLAETRPYPGWVYSARKDLDPEAVAALKAAMLALDPANPEHETILSTAGMRSILAADDTDYHPIRDLARTLGQQSGIK